MRYTHKKPMSFYPSCQDDTEVSNIIWTVIVFLILWLPICWLAKRSEDKARIEKYRVNAASTER